MRTLIKLEELAMFGFGFYLFTFLPFSWWWFFVFLLAPDIGMLGYILGNKIGAFKYNKFNNKCFSKFIYIFLAYY